MISCPDCAYRAVAPASVNHHRGKKHPGSPDKFCLVCASCKSLTSFGAGKSASVCELCRALQLERNAAMRAALAPAPRSPWSFPAAEQRRLDREAAAPGHCTEAQRAARWAYYGGRCWMCRQPAVCMDHVKPLWRGGANWPSNQRPACWACNGRKGIRWPLPAWIMTGDRRAVATAN